MKKADLTAMTIAELKALARKRKITVPGSAKKADIVDALLGASVPEKKRPAARSTAAAGRSSVSSAKAAQPAAVRRAAPEKRAAKRSERPQMAQERVEQAKYHAGTGSGAGRPPSYTELPNEYGEDRIVMMPRDPSVAFAYWEVTPARLAREKEWFGWDSALCIRIYDVTGVHFDGSNAAAYYDQEIQQRFGSWYFHIGRPGHSFVADVGLRAADGRFLVLSRSDTLRMPAEGPAAAAAEGIWALSDEEFREMYGFPEGMSSEEVREFWKARRVGSASSVMTTAAGGKGRYQA